MKICRVIGHVWATKKEERLEGLKLMVVQEDEPGVDLDLLEFESHLLRVPWYRHPDLRSITVGIRQAENQAEP